MAGTLVISTLSDGTNSTSSTNCISGSAKAWARFDGSTGTIAASYNVSSVTRSATGQYVVNFTNALSTANYSVCALSTLDGVIGVSGVSRVMMVQGTSTNLTTSCKLICLNSSSTVAVDGAVQSVAFFI